MNVGVRHFEPGDHQPHPLTGHDLLLGLPDPVGDLHEMGGDADGKIGPLVNLVLRDDEGVAGMKGADVEHGEALVVLVQDPSRDLALDDAGEYRRHGRDGK